MPRQHQAHVHLAPELVAPQRLVGGVAVVIDVLRATTTIVHALAAGCVGVRPAGTVEEARALASALRPGKTLLGGERDGLPLAGFDLGNSPEDYTPGRCAGHTLVLTTTNGTRALLHAQPAERIVIAAFVNRRAICEHLLGEMRPIHILCAGSAGQVALEDALLAGAMIEELEQTGKWALDDGARMALACWERFGSDVEDALRQSEGGAHLLALGYDDDIRAAARVDRFALVPEVMGDPWRIEIARRE